MMKIKKFWLATLLCICSLAVNAYSFKVDGIYYSEDSEFTIPRRAYVCDGDNKYSGDVIIPAYIMYDGRQYEVVGIIWSAFRYCTNLTSVTIEGNIESIGKWAFEGCTSLTSVKLNYVNYSSSELTTIGSDAFRGCTSLKSFSIPRNVTDIDDTAFRGCMFASDKFINYSSCYSSYNWGASLYEKESNGVFINDNEVVACRPSATIATIPEGVTSIGERAFYERSKLTSINIAESVTSIGDEAFYSCSNLTNLTISENVTSIGERAFDACSKLTSIVCLAATPPSMYPTTFSNASEMVLYVPSAYLEEYKTASGWGNFKEIIPLHILTYEVDGNVYKTEIIAYGSVITPITAPAKEGYTFSGWSEMPETMPAEDLTISGHFIINQYRVTFVVDGVELESMLLDYGSIINAPNVPEREGYTFGWSYIPETMLAEDIVVNGTFTANSYRLIYMVDGEVFKTEQVVYGSEIVLIDDIPAKEGYTFSGWSEIPETMPAEDLTISGHFIINSYKLIYMVDGEVFKTELVAYGSDIVLTDEIPAKEGHTFSRWKLPTDHYLLLPIDIASNADAMLYSNAPCTEESYGDQFVGWHVLFDDDANTFFHSEYKNKDSEDGLDHYLRVDMGEGNTIDQFTFTYTVRGDETPYYTPTEIVVEGSNDANGEYEEIAVLTDLPLGRADVYESEVLSNGNAYRYIRYRVTETQYNRKVYGHPYFYFAEFGMSGMVYVPTTTITAMPAHDVVADALFTTNKYKVTFKAGDDIISEEMLDYGSRITVPEVPEKEGQSFNGWGKVDSHVPAHNVTYEGSYSINSYTLTYVVDGESVKEVSVPFGTVIASLEHPSREGYTFSFSDEVPETMPAEDIVVYGEFTINKYRVTFALDGIVKQSKLLEYGAKIEVPTFPEKEGYELRGLENVPETMPAKDIYCNAVYVAKIYQVYYFVGANLVYIANVPYGEKIPEYIYEPKEGEEVFLGWLGDEYEIMPAHDIYLTAEMAPVGIEKLIGDGEQNTVIYDLQGSRVLDTQSLKAGIYIVNGKKVVLK